MVVKREARCIHLQIRVAVVTPGTFPLPSPRSSSVEQVVHETTQRLKYEVKFQIFSKKTTSFSTRSRDENITYWRFRRRSSSSYLRQVSRQMRKFRPQIIQVENRPRYVLYFKKKFPKADVWLSLHSTRYISQPHVSAKLMRRCLRKTDKIIVNSHFLAAYVQSNCPRIMQKIIVNHLGIDTKKFFPYWTEQGMQVRNQMRNHLGYSEKKIILYVGRLLESKGVHVLLQSLPSIIQAHPETVLVIVGSAFYGSNRLTDYVRSLHRLGNRYPSHVRFVPFVPHHEIYRWYLMADLAVVPSQGEEAFGLTNVEAMACGLPVVAVRNGGMVELIREGESGFLIEQGETGVAQLAAYINRLLHDGHLRQMMGEKARQRVEQQFTWEHTAARWYEAYRTAVRR